MGVYQLFGDIIKWIPFVDITQHCTPLGSCVPVLVVFLWWEVKLCVPLEYEIVSAPIK